MIKRLEKPAKLILLVLAVFMFIFSLVSGAEGFGPGIKGIIINSPNSIPWLILLIISYITYKKQALGSILIFILGLFAFVFFLAGLKRNQDFPILRH